ncbi:11304_t:CDS:2 [Acaulospora colombiana]|uniref:11304_t:CDS:1 n=1 Tax=Acaulospora colombiana TaxID=27376 RepID=A0ACA9L2Q0_9GLOM|nr:11304_t:CDS:2 [Acaulospora colombiana]
MSGKEKEDIANDSKLTTQNEDKFLQFQIVTQGGESGVIKESESEILKTENNSEFDRFQNDLELANFETHSVEENLEPWKPRGPWYHDITKRRWFAFAVIGILLVIVLIVGNFL